jgi:hypothetical protein
MLLIDFSHVPFFMGRKAKNCVIGNRNLKGVYNKIGGLNGKVND